MVVRGTNLRLPGKFFVGIDWLSKYYALYFDKLYAVKMDSVLFFKT